MRKDYVILPDSKKPTNLVDVFDENGVMLPEYLPESLGKSLETIGPLLGLLDSEGKVKLEHLPEVVQENASITDELQKLVSDLQNLLTADGFIADKFLPNDSSEALDAIRLDATSDKQTVYDLPFTVTNVSSASIEFNGIFYRYLNDDFQIVDTVLTLKNPVIAPKTGDYFFLSATHK